MEKNICRLCLNLIKNEFEVIDAVTKQMLKVLLLKVDLNASLNPIICTDCGKAIKKSYFFKTTCIDTEEIILSFSTTKEIAKFDIKDVYEDSKGALTVVQEDLRLCIFCMNQIDTINLVSFDVLMSDVMYAEMLPICMSEKVFNMIKDPVICTLCRNSLECYFKLKWSCSDTEEKINRYRRNEGNSCTTPIKLSNVLGSLFKEVLKCDQKTAIKQESLFEDLERDVDYRTQNEQIKCEALEIKDEEGADENNLEICKKNGDISTIRQVHNCGICTYETKYKRYLKTHMLVHKAPSEVKMHKCQICTYETKYRRSLRNHILIHQDTCEMHKCQICGYETKHKKCLKIHMLVHKDISEVEMYKCEICQYESKRKKSLKIHMLVHEDTCEMHKCAICSYETKYKFILKRHTATHKGTTEMEISELCNYETNLKDNPKRRMLEHENVPEEEIRKCEMQHRCEICNYETKYAQRLKNHVLAHKVTSEIRMYKCESCTYETKYKKRLKTHMLVHMTPLEVEMYKCGLCTYETKYKKSLQNHLLIHNHAAIMHKCGICTYETRYKYYLKKHIIVHKDVSEVEMHKCEICTYMTKRRKSLKVHMLTHKDSCKKHKCGLCSYETNYKSCLKRHMVMHVDSTEVEMIKCGICSYETKQKDCFKNHMLSHKQTS